MAESIEEQLELKKMVQKRPFDEELYGFSFKLPKQSKNEDSHSLSSEFFKSEDNALDIVNTIGWKRKIETELYEKNSYFCEDYVRMDNASFPEFYIPERTVQTMPRHEDTNLVLLQRHPQKLVPLGPDHQAEIPPWNPSKAIEDDVQAHLIQDEADELSGITVIPMPDSESSECKIEAGKIICCCNDNGSVRCVRQHVMESRQKLEKAIGSDAFEELGFLEMGEAIAEKNQWTEEEEQFFHRTVLSNPISLGKSFWSRLSSAFPSRIKREIVNYYFNVFILRVRAEQNRFDPSGADSDNDEWHLSDEEEDDDSAVESPLRDFGFVNTINNNIDDDDDLESDEGCDDDAGKAWTADGKNASDDSCTSFDTDATGPVPHTKNHYLWNSCDPKLWDVGYIPCREKKSEFLPTCSMMEEVFGDDSWRTLK